MERWKEVTKLEMEKIQPKFLMMEDNDSNNESKKLPLICMEQLVLVGGAILPQRKLVKCLTKSMQMKSNYIHSGRR
ncbi:hypothetical protein ACT7DB_07785 [Bacillus cereus]